MNTDPSTTSKATTIWDRRYAEGDGACARPRDDTDSIDYTQHDFLYRHLVCKPLTGIPTRESYEFLISKIFQLVNPRRVLAVGSGLAFDEQSLVAADIVETIEAYELSEVAVAEARKRIAEAGMSERLVIHAEDVTKAGLPEDSFDAIYVTAAIHHFFNIEEMMDLFHRVLKPGGILVYNEYVGPDHHLYHAKVYEILDQINECLDPSLRVDVLRGAVRDQVPRATLDWMLDMDPSEGVHASRILPLTYEKFEVVQRYDYGGTLMRPFWCGVLPNFDFSQPKDQTIARLIGLIEELLLNSGEIPTYHTLVAARKVPGRAPAVAIENDLLARKPLGKQFDGLEPTFFGPENVLGCVDHTDANWDRGVIRHGALRLLVSASAQAENLLRSGARIILGTNKAALIGSIERVQDLFIVNCVRESFDRLDIAAPARFWVSHS